MSESKVVKVTVEYCASWGYYGRFLDLKAALEKQCSDIDVSGFEGRAGSFEVSVGEKAVFSKLATYGFPYEKDIVEAIEKSRKGEEPSVIENSQMTCTIL